MFDTFMKLALGLVVLAVIAVVVTASIEAIIPVLIVAGVIYALYHVCAALS